MTYFTGSTLFSRHILLLFGTLLLALWLNLWGIGFGLPYVGSYSDEMFITDNAIHLLRQERLDLSRWGIGNAQIYLQVLIGKVILTINNISAADLPTYGEIITAKNIHIATIDVPYPLPQFYWWGRASVAILGGFSVVLTYLVGRVVKSPMVGLISAFFLAANALHAEHAHYITRTAPGLFFLLLAFYIILLAFLKHNWWLYGASLPLIYLAIHIKQNNLILLAPLLVGLSASLWQELRQRPATTVFGYVGLVTGILVLVLVIGRVFWAFNGLIWGQNIINRVFFNSFVFGGSQIGYSGQNTWWWIIDQLFINPRAAWRLVALLAVPGIYLALQLPQKGWFLFTIPLPYLLMMSFFTVRFENWLVPVIPFLAILAALSLEWIYYRMARVLLFKRLHWQVLFGLIVILIALPSIRVIATLNYYTHQTDVRQVAEQWLRTHLPSGSKVVVDLWGPYLGDSQLDVVYVEFIGDEDLQTYREQQIDYLVLNSMSISRRALVDEADTQAQDIAAIRQSRITQIIKTLPLEQKFVGPTLLNLPVIEVLVYKVQ